MSRATVIAMRLAMTPPEVRIPKLWGPYPTRSHSQRPTSSSTNALLGPACHTSTPWLVNWARSSPTIDIVSGGGVK